MMIERIISKRHNVMDAQRETEYEWVTVHMSEGPHVRRFTCPKVHMSEGPLVRRSTCPKVHLSEGFVIRSNTLINNLFLWLKNVNPSPNLLPNLSPNPWEESSKSIHTSLHLFIYLFSAIYTPLIKTKRTKTMINIFH